MLVAMITQLTCEFLVHYLFSFYLTKQFLAKLNGKYDIFFQMGVWNNYVFIVSKNIQVL